MGIFSKIFSSDSSKWRKNYSVNGGVQYFSHPCCSNGSSFMGLGWILKLGLGLKRKYSFSPKKILLSNFWKSTCENIRNLKMLSIPRVLQKRQKLSPIYKTHRWTLRKRNCSVDIHTNFSRKRTCSHDFCGVRQVWRIFAKFCILANGQGTQDLLCGKVAR